MSVFHGLAEITRYYAFLGITSFGGPNVHFLILNNLFVRRLEWIDDTTFADLLAIGTASPGPASTCMAYSIALLRSGAICAVWAITLWILPGAIGMFALGLGVRQIGDTLPSAVYMLLTGVNSAAVGLIFQAGYNLSAKAVSDKWTLLILFFSASISILYTSQWLFPVLMVAGGGLTWLVDCVPWNEIAQRLKVRRPLPLSTAQEQQAPIELPDVERGTPTGISQRRPIRDSGPQPPSQIPLERVHEQADHVPPIWVGVVHFVAFFAGFIAVIVAEPLLPSPSLAFALFRNMLLAGTIIFGGGPVVIPLLAEYVVKPGWVSPRDFLLGLAIIQGFPGPNFNFAVYLGCLTLKDSPVAGAIIAGLAIFLPGLTLRTAILPLWSHVRRFPFIRAILRGVASAAVGLIWSALVRLSQVAIVGGTSSENIVEIPFFVIVAAGAFVLCEWFKMPPFGAVLVGATAGIAQWGAAGAPS